MYQLLAVAASYVEDIVRIRVCRHKSRLLVSVVTRRAVEPFVINETAGDPDHDRRSARTQQRQHMADARRSCGDARECRGKRR
jgi:hypothetical protein